MSSNTAALTPNEYRLLVERAPIMIWRAEPGKKCDYFNRVWLDFTGRSLEQELGDGWVEGVHPEDLDACFRTYVTAFDRRQAFEMEYRLRRHDGAWRWIFDRGVPFSTDDGDFGGYIGSCVDVTERREAQQALARTAELELQMLRGILPICSHCKRIRDDDGSWSPVEGYVARHSAAKFSHGICPSCMSEHYGDLLDDRPGPL